MRFRYYCLILLAVVAAPSVFHLLWNWRSVEEVPGIPATAMVRSPDRGILKYPLTLPADEPARGEEIRAFLQDVLSEPSVGRSPMISFEFPITSPAEESHPGLVIARSVLISSNKMFVERVEGDRYQLMHLDLDDRPVVREGPTDSYAKLLDAIVRDIAFALYLRDCTLAPDSVAVVPKPD